MKSIGSMNFFVVGLLALALFACGGDDEEEKTCKVDDPSSCGAGMVCEPVQGESKPACFHPVKVQGRVFDLETLEPVSGARVMAEESSGRPVGDVAVTDEDGRYALRIPSVRTSPRGAPVGQTLKMSAAAQDFRPFPSGLRMALPIDTTAATGEKAFVVTGAATEIGLEPMPRALQGLPSISGRVERPASREQNEILVVAEPANVNASTITGKADSRGAYILFNVEEGDYEVKAYRKGSNYRMEDVSVSSTDVENIDLALGENGTASLSGSVAVVAGSGATSIVLVLESTFDEVLARGVLVPGLRAPEPGVAPNVTGAFTIQGIPDGNYVVLAAFENDGLVRDPDPEIAGTQIQHIAVRAGTVDSSPAFKVTSAVRMVGPGAGGTIEEISAAPTFRWEAYPSAKSYLLELFDTYGNPVWSTTATEPGVAYDGEAALEPGLPYQWRVTAFGNASNPISLTEDLLGVFRLAQ